MGMALSGFSASSLAHLQGTKLGKKSVKRFQGMQPKWKELISNLLAWLAANLVCILATNYTHSESETHLYTLQSKEVTLTSQTSINVWEFSLSMKTTMIELRIILDKHRLNLRWWKMMMIWSNHFLVINMWRNNSHWMTNLLCELRFGNWVCVTGCMQQSFMTAIW